MFCCCGGRSCILIRVVSMWWCVVLCPCSTPAVVLQSPLCSQQTGNSLRCFTDGLMLWRLLCGNRRHHGRRVLHEMNVGVRMSCSDDNVNVDGNAITAREIQTNCDDPFGIPRRNWWGSCRLFTSNSRPLAKVVQPTSMCVFVIHQHEIQIVT